MMPLTWEKDLPCKKVGVPPHFEKRFLVFQKLLLSRLAILENITGEL